MTIVLPEILQATTTRPGSQPKRYQQRVPDREYQDFWEKFYEYLTKNFSFNKPLPGAEERVDPYFGYFGPCFHPVTHEANYYHVGLAITDEPRTPVLPVRSGVLEYAGYGMINGNYVMLSHPDIVTEDGFTLYSLYLHMQELHVGFSGYQKMLREISLHRYPEIMIADTSTLGTVGDSGIVAGLHTHLQLQLEFRNAQNVSIAIDPAPILGIERQVNKTASIATDEDFHKIYDREYDILEAYGIKAYWEQGH